MRTKPIEDSAGISSMAPSSYNAPPRPTADPVVPDSDRRPDSGLPFPDTSAGLDGQPLVLLRRALRYSGTRPSVPRQRRIRACALLYIRSGAGELTVNHVRIKVTGNQLLLLTPGMHIVESCDPLADWDAHYIAFKLMRPVRSRSGWTLEAFDSVPQAHNGFVEVADYPAIERLIGQIVGDGSANGLQHWKRQLSLAELLYTLMLELGAPKHRSLSDSIRRCAAYMDRHYADNVRMDKLAEWCGLHPSTFSRHFKQTVGMSPSDYLTHVRIETAKTMLSGSLPLREVSRKVGFCDEYYFSRMFKKVAGVSPSVYTRTTNARLPDGKRNGSILEPVNVAVTYVDEADHLIALGLLPAAVPSDHALDGSEATIPYLQQYVRHLPRIGCEDTLDKSLLRKLGPDLIIACAYMKVWGVTGLDDIAPTHYYMWEVDWRNVHRQLASTLGREAQAEHNIAQFDNLVRSARDMMFRACVRKTFVFLETTSEGIRVSPYMSNGGWLLYQQLGFNPAPIVSVNGWNHYVTPEEAASIRADYLFIGQRSGSRPAHEALMRHPDMQRIRSKLIEVPRYPWGKGGPIAFSRGVKHILSFYEKIHK